MPEVEAGSVLQYMDLLMGQLYIRPVSENGLELFSPLLKRHPGEEPEGVFLIGSERFGSTGAHADDH